MNNLLRLIGRRLVVLPIMVISVTFLVFFIASLFPTDSAYAALGDNVASVAQAKAPRVAHDYTYADGTSALTLTRCTNYLAGILWGDFRVYRVSNDSIGELISPTLPITLRLTFLGLIIAVLFSFSLGVLVMFYRDKWPDQLIHIISVVPIGTPSFWLGTMPVLIGPNTFPGMMVGPLSLLLGPGADSGGWLSRMSLSSLTLTVPVIGQMTHMVRTSVIEELGRDYVRTAQGAGIPKAIVIGRSVLRDALIIPVTVLGLWVSYLISGAVVIEIIFDIQSMGKVLAQGIQQSQVEVVQGTALVVALIFIITNTVVDMLYLLTDPWIRSV